MKNGPVIASINTNDDQSFLKSGMFKKGKSVSFGFYSSGILQQDTKPKDDENLEYLSFA